MVLWSCWLWISCTSCAVSAICPTYSTWFCLQRCPKRNNSQHKCPPLKPKRKKLSYKCWDKRQRQPTWAIWITGWKSWWKRGRWEGRKRLRRRRVPVGAIWRRKLWRSICLYSGMDGGRRSGKRQRDNVRFSRTKVMLKCEHIRMISCVLCSTTFKQRRTN